MSTLHHVGIAVHDLARAVETWQVLLGTSAGPVVEVPEEGVRIAFLCAGSPQPGGSGGGFPLPGRSPKIELLEPLSADGPIAKFLEKRGEGIHHVAFAVPDIRAAMERLRAQGVPVLDAEPRFRGGNRWVVFCHPKGANGVLTELVQYTSAEAEEAGT